MYSYWYATNGLFCFACFESKTYHSVKRVMLDLSISIILGKNQCALLCHVVTIAIFEFAEVVDLFLLKDVSCLGVVLNINPQIPKFFVSQAMAT